MTDLAISAVIPVRNRAAIIGRAVHSALGQTRPPEEVIVVDDGSTDGTPDAVAAIAAAHPRVRLVALPQRLGAPRARNRGVAEATGALIAFLDSDDTWRPAKIARQLALLEANPAAAAAFTGIRYHYRNRRPHEDIPPPRITPEQLFAANILGTCSSALVRRAAFDLAGGFEPELTSCQDWDLWLRLSDHGALLAVQEPLTEYVASTAGSISRDATAVVRGHAIVHGRIYARIRDPRARRDVEIEHMRGLAARLSRRTFAPGMALGFAVRGLAGRPDLAGLRVLAATVLRIGIAPLRHGWARRAGAAQAARGAASLLPAGVQ